MTPDKSDKAKALDLALSHIERQFGRGSLMRLGAAGAFTEVAVIPTGSLALDAALGVGGIPRGRITEIYGPEASGKTTLALHVIAEAQKAGGIAAFVDAEHALGRRVCQSPGGRCRCAFSIPARYGRASAGYRGSARTQWGSRRHCGGFGGSARAESGT